MKTAWLHAWLLHQVISMNLGKVFIYLFLFNQL